MLQRLQNQLQKRLARTEPDPPHHVLTRRHIYILPTKQGITFAFVLFLMLLGDINYSLSMGYLLTFLLVVIAILSIIYTFRNLAGLEIIQGHNEPVFCGDTAWFRFQFVSPIERYRVCLCDKLRHNISVDIKQHSKQNGLIQHEVLFAVPTEQRGWLELGPITIYTEFPFGLFRAWSYIHFDHRCLVYPRPAEASTLPSNYQQDATGKSHFGGDEDFYGLRKFVRGDVLSHVDWKAFARERGLLVKQFMTPSGQAIWLDLDHAPGNNLETQLRYLTRWVLDAEKIGVEYGLKLPGKTIDISRGSAHRNTCLYQLAMFGSTP